ncbi:phage tail terminator-like protein [Segnochrobactraceae bacterium EtOH-i3]
MNVPEPITLLWLALRSRVETIPFSPAMPIAWPADSFEPGGAAYLSVSFQPGDPGRLTIGDRGPHPLTGSMAVALVVPVALQWDPARILNNAGVIAKAFPPGLVMRCGTARATVTKPATIQPVYRDGAYFRAPVIVRWQASI